MVSYRIPINSAVPTEAQSCSRTPKRVDEPYPILLEAGSVNPLTLEQAILDQDENLALS